MISTNSGLILYLFSSSNFFLINAGCWLSIFLLSRTITCKIFTASSTSLNPASKLCVMICPPTSPRRVSIAFLEFITMAWLSGNGSFSTGVSRSIFAAFATVSIDALLIPILFSLKCFSSRSGASIIFIPFLSRNNVARTPETCSASLLFIFPLEWDNIHLATSPESTTTRP